MKSCQHPSLRIDGVYPNDDGTPQAVAWTCRECKTSGATAWEKAPEEMQKMAMEGAGG